jgi:hypothetical protein
MGVGEDRDAVSDAFDVKERSLSSSFRIGQIDVLAVNISFKERRSGAGTYSRELISY